MRMPDDLPFVITVQFDGRNQEAQMQLAGLSCGHCVHIGANVIYLASLSPIGAGGQLLFAQFIQFGLLSA